ncbi:SGNH/GDSL hydrolase family protein [Streptacidiphilus sp. PB12-B1b]|nr:SGNH/GDSL hydrolase family protein [Streptacidiphilus sp. PB12-B1b]
MARRAAAAAAFGGGGIGLIGAGAAALLLAEAKIAEIQLGVLQGEPPRADGVYGRQFAGGRDAVPLRMVVLGDSTAAGFGVDRADCTPGALLAGGIAATAERPVRLAVVAVNGATSTDLERQCGLALDGPAPDIALIMIGANDIAQLVKPSDSARMLGGTVRRLRAAGAQVVVGTCPDLGAVDGILPPLRTLARRASHQLAAAQTAAVTEAGGRSVALGALLGREFAGRPEMFASDRYHPSARGYLAAAMTLLPSMCAALGVWPQEDDPGTDALGPDAPRAVREGAQRAAAALLGRAAGPTGRWSLSKRPSRRQPAVLPNQPEPAT